MMASDEKKSENMDEEKIQKVDEEKAEKADEKTEIVDVKNPPKVEKKAVIVVKKQQIPIPKHHRFPAHEVKYFREALLYHYERKKRDLPWRMHVALVEDASQRAYFTWVSEIMLQQTQVATVIDYYNKWIAKWPTIKALSKATLDEVNEAWSGLGYYSRGRRLHEGAQKLAKKKGKECCQMPRTIRELTKELPGVGRYTACAIASIAYGDVTGLVDGNVMRVLSRMRNIGSPINTQTTAELFWYLANRIVDPENPGDFNQALMEHGALICTPKAPKCTKCPVKGICKAYARKIKFGVDVDNRKITDAFKRGDFGYDTDDEVIDLTYGMDKIDTVGGKKEETEGDKKVAEGDTKVAEGDNKTTEGDNKTAEGDKKNAEGDDKGADGDKVTSPESKEVKMETVDEAQSKEKVMCMRVDRPPNKKAKMEMEQKSPDENEVKDNQEDDTTKSIETDKCPTSSDETSGTDTTYTTDEEEYVLPDIEDIAGCPFCIPADEPWNPLLGVLNYPRKAPKQPPGVEYFISAVIEYDDRYLFSQRPNKGLLANMWEFPLTQIGQEEATQREDEKMEISILRKELKRRFNIVNAKKPKLCGEVTHVFSHKYHIYRVFFVDLKEKLELERCVDGRKLQWMAEKEADKSAITKAIRKIMAVKNGCLEGQPGFKRKRKPGCEPLSYKIIMPRSQPTIEDMMNKTKKKKKNDDACVEGLLEDEE